MALLTTLIMVRGDSAMWSHGQINDVLWEESDGSDVILHIQGQHVHFNKQWLCLCFSELLCLF